MAETPHNWTKAQVVSAVAGTVFAGVVAYAAIVNLGKPSGTSIQGPVSVGPGSAAINAGTINNGPIYNGATPSRPEPRDIFANCEQVPSIDKSSDGVSHVIQLQAIAAPYNPGMHHVSGGGNFHLGVNSLYRCRVTNYTSSPLFKPKLFFRAVFSEAVKDETNPNASHSGKTTLDTNWWFEIPKIDSGKDAPFDLYIFNMTQKYAQLFLVPKITLVGGETVDLIEPTTTGMHFSPYIN